MSKEGRSSPMRQPRPRGKPRATLRVSQAELLKECQAQLVAATEREAGFMAWVEGRRDDDELDQILAEVELARLEELEATLKKKKKKKRTKGRRNRRSRNRFMLGREPAQTPAGYTRLSKRTEEILNTNIAAAQAAAQATAQATAKANEVPKNVPTVAMKSSKPPPLNIWKEIRSGAGPTAVATMRAGPPKKKSTKRRRKNTRNRR